MHTLWIKADSDRTTRRVVLRQILALMEGRDVEPDSTNFRSLKEREMLQERVNDKFDPLYKPMIWGYTQHWNYQVTGFFCFRSQYGNQFMIYEVLIEHNGSQLVYFYIETMNDAVAVQLKLMGICM